MNNRRRWLFSQQARWFTSLFDADAIAQRARIVADGGELYFNAAQGFIRGLKTLNVYDSARILADPRFALKKDGSNHLSRLYDLSPNYYDLFQNTGSAMPTWAESGGRNGGATCVFAKGKYFSIPPSVWGEQGKNLTVILRLSAVNDSSVHRILEGNNGCFKIQYENFNNYTGISRRGGWSWGLFSWIVSGAAELQFAVSMSTDASNVATLRAFKELAQTATTTKATGALTGTNLTLGAISAPNTLSGTISALYVFDQTLSLETIQAIAAL